ncbi:MAG: hypothetical protein ACI9WU_000419 [Myxococcota bacterium]|jgi:hypothetical protein
MRRHALLLTVVMATTGCKEMSNLFDESEKVAQEQGWKDASVSAQEAKAEAEKLRRETVEARMAHAMKRPTEPKERGPKVIWLVEQRVKCSTFQCSQEKLDRLKSLGDISQELLPALNHKGPSIQIEAIKLVGLLEIQDLSQPLIDRLNDSSLPTRKAVITSLRWLKNPSALGPLISRIDRIGQGEERGWLLGAISVYHEPRAVRALGKAAQGSDTSVAITAVEALGRRKGELVVQALDGTVALAEAPPVKLAALDALAREGSAGAKLALKAWTRTGDKAVRAKAKRLLKRK